MKNVKYGKCVRCGRTYEAKPDLTNCECGGILDIVYDYDYIKTVLTKEKLARRENRSMWRYRELLPVEETTPDTPLRVGWSPLYEEPNLARLLGLRKLWIKDDGQNPTASLKDRASAMAVAKAYEAGARTIACSSTGNAASSLAGNAAAAGFKTYIFVPERAPKGKVAQLMIFGANVISVKGNYEETFKMSAQAIEKYGWYNRNAAINPYLSEGKKTVALEIALGAALQNIVVDREEDAKAAIGYLKQRDGGRATFLPLTAIRGEELRDRSVEREFGFVGLASRLVRFDEKYTNIFHSLLGRTVVVEDLDCGIAMARKYRNAFRIVTLDGQVINRGGSMTGGSVSRSAGVLSRASELSGLREQLTGLKASLGQAAHRAEETGRDLQKAQYELDVAREQQQNAAQQVLALETRGQHYDSLRETLNATLEALDAENLRLTRQTADGDARRRELQTKIDGQEDLARQLRQQAQNCLAGQSELQTKTGGISDRIARRKEQQAALAAERQGAESRLADLRQLMTDLDGDCRSREDLARQLHESQVRAREQMAEHQTRCDSLHRQAEDLRGQLQTLQREKLDLEQQRTALNRQTQTCNDAVIAAQQELSRLEQKRSAAAMEEKTILDKLWERYELSHSEAQAQRVELESIPKATRRIGELNRSIKALGTPNIGAIEEYERVNGRYTYLSDQRADVEKAKGELTGVIDQLTQQMTEIFAQQFRLLNDSFQETFLELFGGGKARLELEDEKDILNCGIEIKVQPPGKQLKTITLLSGGEKAFVAIALYFAILKVHPTPFCVMDEIEAALDEANVVRYARYMRRIAGKTQFIVITHRRGTMEEADVLYGVTMQERGVSRILTINLNDMAKELNIK